MSNTFQCMKLCVYGRKFVVIQHFHDTNPFWLYEITDGRDRYGYPTQKKRLLEKYCSFEGIWYHLHQMNIPEFKIDWNPYNKL